MEQSLGSEGAVQVQALDVSVAGRHTRALLAASCVFVVALLAAYLLVVSSAGALSHEHWLVVVALVIAVTAMALLRRREGEVASDRLELDERQRQEQLEAVELARRREEIAAVVALESHMEIHYQPIVTIVGQEVVGHEGLARFETGSPAYWFARAEEVGLGRELDLTALTKALAQVDDFEGYLSVNVSPATLLEPHALELFAGVDATKVVIELTEHFPVDDYDRYRPCISELRGLGVRIAVDDAGAGHSSMRHIVRLAPEFVKLDRSLVDHVDTDPARRALVAAMTGFASSIGATLIAEGVERQEEANILFEIGVPYAQGYLFGRPEPHAVALPR